PAGRLANGGDSVPYAPLERTLLGLAPAPDTSIRGLRGPVWLGLGRVRAEGGCTVAARDLVGAAPGPRRAPGPLRIGLVVRTRQALAPSALAGWADDLAEFAARAADAIPARLNFHEATGGRGALRPTVARPAPGACEDPEPALPSAP
ncbi:MAG: hypothetical protein KC613_20255, partial [Myxococcales bacterium]|nr:hypothetical protein [Myxococcales bacterium]